MNRFIDFLLGLFARFIFPSGPSQGAFDMDHFFDRISDAGENLVDRVQRMLMLVLATIGLTALATAVLTVRIFQLSAMQTVSIAGFEIDGALLFGLILFFGSGGLAYWAFGRERRYEKELREERHHHHEPSPPPPASPLEEAAALWIRRTIERQDEMAADQRRREQERQQAQQHHPTPPLSPEPPPWNPTASPSRFAPEA